MVNNSSIYFKSKQKVGYVKGASQLAIITKMRFTLNQSKLKI